VPFSIMPGKCGRCQKDVYDAEEVTAAGRKWHQSCFKCATCKCALSSENLRDKDGEIYCAPCYGRNFGAKGYGFGGGGGVGLQSGKYEGAESLHGSAAIDAEIQRKLNLKYDSDKEGKIRAWLETLLGAPFEEKTLQEALKSGARLCEAVNKITPNLVKKINKGNFPAMQRENIAAYIAACKFMAFNKASLFETSDLYDGKNMVLVIENCLELSRRAAKKGLAHVSGYEVDGGAAASGGGPASPARYASPVAPVSPAPAPAPARAPAASPSPAPAEAPAAEPAAPAAAGGESCPDCGAPRTGDFCSDCGHQFVA